MAEYNYISQFITYKSFSYSYHNNTIILNESDLKSFIKPDVLEYFKDRSNFFESYVCDNNLQKDYNSSWKDNINYNIVIENLRNFLGKSLVLIHTWSNENNHNDLINLLNSNYSTYYDFFDTIFNYMSLIEHNSYISSIIKELKENLYMFECYLGEFKGNYSNCVYDTKDILSSFGTLFILIIYSQLFN